MRLVDVAIGGNVPFTYRIVEIYGELAEERINELGGGAGTESARRIFSELKTLLKGTRVTAAIRRDLKKRLKEDWELVMPGIGDVGLRAFVRFALEYIRDRIIVIPRYIYLPWKAADAQELMRWSQSWKTFARGRGKTFDIVSQDSSRDAFKEIHPLSQIYIVGHGAPGTSHLTKSAELIDDKGLSQQQRAAKVAKVYEPVDFSILVTRLISTGLPKSFAGSLKIYACSGGRSGTQSIDSLLARPMEPTSFTKLFAQCMRSKGYKDCDIVGYLENLAAPSMFDDVGGRTIAVSPVEKELLGKMSLLQTQLELKEAAKQGNEQLAQFDLEAAFERNFKASLRALDLPKASVAARRF
jgi:hypothetical protein